MVPPNQLLCITGIHYYMHSYLLMMRCAVSCRVVLFGVTSVLQWCWHRDVSTLWWLQAQAATHSSRTTHSSRCARVYADGPGVGGGGASCVPNYHRDSQREWGWCAVYRELLSALSVAVCTPCLPPFINTNNVRPSCVCQQQFTFPVV